MNNLARKMAMLSIMYASMESLYNPSITKHYVTGTPARKRQPWDTIQLSKNERKGKTYEEMQSLRKEKYEALQTV